MEFKVEPGFCGNCGTILPMIADTGNILCYLCKSDHGPNAYGTMEATYVIHFNARDKYRSLKPAEEEADGPIVERKCRKCGNERMSYATLQLRSADEGQTVFYTCTKCRHKEVENS